MESMIKVEVNCETGEEQVIELTPDEITAFEAQAAEAAARQHEEEVKMQEKLAARESAKVKLEGLGMTEEELAALFN